MAVDCVALPGLLRSALIYILRVFLFSECLLFCGSVRDSDLLRFVFDYILVYFGFLNVCFSMVQSGGDSDVM